MDSNEGWNKTSIIIHWLTALIVFGLFAVGLWMTSLNYYSPWYRVAPFWHKSIGITLFFLTIFRIYWRHKKSAPMALPSHTKHEQILAHLMHVLLYVLLFSIMISGYLISTADGRAISVFNLFSVPALPLSFANQEDTAGMVHLYLAYLIIFMATLHAGAAIKHHFVDKDNTLKRMLFSKKKRRKQ